MNSLVKNRVFVLLLLVAVSALALAACGSSEEEKEGIVEGAQVELRAER